MSSILSKISSLDCNFLIEGLTGQQQIMKWQKLINKGFLVFTFFFDKIKLKINKEFDKLIESKNVNSFIKLVGSLQYFIFSYEKKNSIFDEKAINLLKEICDGIGLNNDLFNIEDNVIEYFIENHTHESGVRELKRKIESLFLKLNIDKYYENILIITSYINTIR